MDSRQVAGVLKQWRKQLYNGGGRDAVFIWRGFNQITIAKKNLRSTLAVSCENGRLQGDTPRIPDALEWCGMSLDWGQLLPDNAQSEVWRAKIYVWRADRGRMRGFIISFICHYITNTLVVLSACRAMAPVGIHVAREHMTEATSGPRPLVMHSAPSATHRCSLKFDARKDSEASAGSLPFSCQWPEASVPLSRKGPGHLIYRVL